MRSFRAVYDDSMHPFQGRFRIHVIGCRVRFDHLVNMPNGVSCVFIHIFHQPVRVKTKTGMVIVPENTLLAIEPYKPLHLGWADRPWTHSWVRCSGSLVDSVFAENGIEYHTPIYFNSAEMNMGYLLELHQEMHHPKGAIPENTEDIFRIWMRNIRRSQTLQATMSVPENFLRAKQFIEIHFLESISLDDIAHAAALSRPHLCRGFKQFFQTSPVNYAIKLKIQHAAELLKDIDMNISDVAHHCNFPDLFYFSRTFKKQVGLSPSQFRKEYL